MKKYFLYCFIALLPLCSCEKFLDEKPDKKLAVPTSVEDIQALLDEESTMNLNNQGPGEVSADNYFVTDAVLAAVPSVAQRSMYSWGADITFEEFPNHWSRLYDVVTVANIALENLDKLPAASADQVAWNNAKGSALLYRGKSFLMVIGGWTKAFDKSRATTELGIPLRLSSDYEIRSVRSNLQESYDRVIADLKASLEFLPERPQHPYRPSRVAAFGLLSRTYLMMAEFDSALIYAQKYLDISPALINFNTLNAGASFPVTKFNVESTMYSSIPVPGILSNTRARIDSTLFNSFETDDLRRTVYFRLNSDGTRSFKGSYAQAQSLFNAVATDEMYLVKAECLARKNEVAAAMDALNGLLITRWRENTFMPFTAASKEDAMNIILRERRKELIYRDLRWTDLKRLNLEPAYQVIVKRKINGAEIILGPNDNRYALPIPQPVINISGMQQNPR